MEPIEEITDNFDKKMVTAGVFIDLKKVFDTIDYNILISKLCHYDIRGYEIVKRLFLSKKSICYI